jgi:2-haloacid dehalogenase
VHALFDLNGTLFDTGSVAAALGDVPDSEQLVAAVFAEAVRQGMLATVTDAYEDFSTFLERAAARELLLAGAAERLDALLAATGRMLPTADALDAIAGLQAAGIGVGVLTNSATATARELIDRAGIEGLELVLGSDEVGAFKPARRVYRAAVSALDAAPEEVVLLTVHWWDAAGAKRAGLRTGYAERKEGPMLATEPAPDWTGGDLRDVARAVILDRGG